MAKRARELQFATHQLVAVFLGLLALCAFVFLLGISMGSKKTTLAAKAGAKALKIETPAGPSPADIDSRNRAGAAEITPGPIEPKPVAAAAKTESAKPAGKPAAEPGNKASIRPETKPDIKAPAVKPEAKKPSAATTPGWYIQVAAGDTKPDAETLVRKLEKDGYPAFVMDPLPRDKKALYRVRVGPYENKAEAEKAKIKLAEAAKKKNTDYFLVKG
ncbi:MAG: SPOR domain-containing protein [Acidobacteriota bacterium]|nr:SPOR domain-containing protein [Acidobacteriota bacterium]